MSLIYFSAITCFEIFIRLKYRYKLNHSNDDILVGVDPAIEFLENTGLDIGLFTFGEVFLSIILLRLFVIKLLRLHIHKKKVDNEDKLRIERNFKDIVKRFSNSNSNTTTNKNNTVNNNNMTNLKSKNKSQNNSIKNKTPRENNSNENNIIDENTVSKPNNVGNININDKKNDKANNKKQIRFKFSISTLRSLSFTKDPNNKNSLKNQLKAAIGLDNIADENENDDDKENKNKSENANSSDDSNGISKHPHGEKVKSISYVTSCGSNETSIVDSIGNSNLSRANVNSKDIRIVGNGAARDVCSQKRV